MKFSIFFRPYMCTRNAHVESHVLNMKFIDCELMISICLLKYGNLCAMKQPVSQLLLKSLALSQLDISILACGFRLECLLAYRRTNKNMALIFRFTTQTTNAMKFPFQHQKLQTYQMPWRMVSMSFQILLELPSSENPQEQFCKLFIYL